MAAWTRIYSAAALAALILVDSRRTASAAGGGAPASQADPVGVRSAASTSSPVQEAEPAPPSSASSKETAPTPASQSNAGVRAGAPAAAGSSKRDDLPLPEEIALRAGDGHAFAADFYPPTSAIPSPGILLIPDLGGSRKSLAALAVRFQGLGYRAMAMDNSGQMRSVVLGNKGLQTFTPLDSKTLMKFVLDVAAAQEALVKQPGVSKGLAAVGYGIGANLALQRAGESDEIGSVALIRPGFGCAEVDPYEALALLGKRPAILIESQKKFGSDLSRAYHAVAERHKDLSREQIVVPRAPAGGSSPAGHADDDIEAKLLDWITRTLPVSTR